MMHQWDVWPCLQARLSVTRWTTIQDIYTLVKTDIPPDREDLEDAGIETSTPKWQHTIRSCLADRKKRGDIEHGGRAMYRLTPKGAQRATLAQGLTDAEVDAFVRHYLAMGPEERGDIDRVLAEMGLRPLGTDDGHSRVG